MKSLKKVFLAFAVVSAMTAATATAAMAADEAVYTPDTNTVTEYNTPTIESGKQYTILVVKKGSDATVAENIYYIDQEADGNFTVKPKVGESGTLEDGEYEVRVGGEDVDQIVITTFKVGGGEATYTLGDVNNKDGINAQDAVAIIDHYLGNIVLEDTDEYAAATAADVNKKDGINVQDAVMVLDYYLGNIASFE